MLFFQPHIVMQYHLACLSTDKAIEINSTKSVDLF